MKIKNNVKHFREMLGLTQAQLARKIGCCQSLISMWERQLNTPSAKLAFKLTKLLHKKGYSASIEGIMCL